MEPFFTAEYSKILEKMDQIDPLKYGETRNYTDGSVTYLSPYISGGVIFKHDLLQRTSVQ